MSMIEPRPSVPAGIGHSRPDSTPPASTPFPAGTTFPTTAEPGLAPREAAASQPAARRGGVRWHLREATADLHEVADTLGSDFDLGTTGDYARFLRAHARALLPLEAALAEAGIEDFLPDWPLRRRGAALRADLAALGEAVPQAPRLSLHTAAAALGAAYVLEGSRMGNGLLLRRIRDGGLPAAYLAHAGAPGGWPGFLAQLESALRMPALWQAAAEGARAAFTLFLAALRQEAGPGHRPA
jgi:heme oxygenase